MDDAARRVRDEWIVLRCQLGEPEAFADLVRETERPLLYYVTKLLKDENQAFDVLQELWVVAFRKIRRIKDPRSVRAWLYRIAHGLTIDRVRRKGARDRAEKARAESSPEAGEAPSFGAEDADAVHRALEEIDVKHREVLVLHFLEDLSVAEIASVVGCPEGTVKSRIYYAKQALKDVLTEGRYGITR
jgi:RNA polymerase sigma-70 factor (ECF subfamily)